MNDSHEPAMTPQQRKLTAGGGSRLAQYREMATGNASLVKLLYFEAVTLCLSNMPGLLGYGGRSILYPPLFRSCGGRLSMGRGVTLRGTQRTHLGKSLLIDDYAVLDARGEEAIIELGNHVSIGRFSSVVAKNARITLGDGTNIGSFCRIATQSNIELGESVLVAAYVYIGPGNHQRGDADEALISREMEIKGGVKIGAQAWIGTRATILDGVTVGARAIVGAHSFVNKDVPEGAIVAGTPARVVGEVPSGTYAAPRGDS